MTPKDLKQLRIKNELFCAPKPYIGEADLVGGDYEVNACLLNIAKQSVIEKVKSFIDAEEDYVYGPTTSYKNSYRYNGDD
jgi:hypothetical protein